MPDLKKSLARILDHKKRSGESQGGTADNVPAELDGVMPAALSEGEYVIPADIVSHLGDGNSTEGSKILDALIESIRDKKTGNKEIPDDMLKGWEYLTKGAEE